ncbi:MAG: hypothetical protein WBK88_10360 [Methanothrix sp.]
MTGGMMAIEVGYPKADDDSSLAVAVAASTLEQDFRFIEKVALEKFSVFDRDTICVGVVE